MRTSSPRIKLPSGNSMPSLGLGTWGMGDDKRSREDEVAALRLGLDLGMTLVDTAEMYADGRAEAVAASAIAGRREEVFVVSKVYPHNATRAGVIAACKRSLKRLGVQSLDLYLLHWRGSIPLSETVAGFEALRAEGCIAEWGVSNFDRADMEELFGVAHGDRCVANQVLYHLGSRGIEWDLLPWCRERGIAVMAYSPLGQADLLRHPLLGVMAERAGCTAAQLAIAWLLLRSVAVIPKASSLEHVRDNSAAPSVSISTDVLAEIDRRFPPPQGPAPLAML